MYILRAMRPLAPTCTGRLTFWSLLALLFGVSGWVCYHEPIAGDCWTGVDWQPILTSIPAVARLIEWNYLECNPRFGETFLYLTGGSRALHTFLTPLVIVLTIVGLMILAIGRLPRPRQRRDSGILVVTVALVCVSVHTLGQEFFYRPHATNYLYGFCVQLWFLVPLRIHLAHAPSPGTENARGRAAGPRWWLVAGMPVLGFLAGMCNEHTGPTLILAVLILGAGSWNRHPGARPLLAAALVGLVAGYLALFFAPGQLHRYAGMGREPLLDRILAHGPQGVLRLLTSFAVEARWGLLVLVAAVAHGAIQHRRERTAGTPWTIIVMLLGGAVSIVLTLLASPFTAARLLLASALLVAAAALAALLPLLNSRRAFAAMVGVASLIVAFHAIRFIQVFASLDEDYRARARFLAQAPRGSVAYVQPVRHFFETHWALGDDLAVEGWRRSVGQRYGMHTLALDTKDARILQASGVATAWHVDANSPAETPLLPTVTTPVLKPLDRAAFERARQYAIETAPVLDATGGAARAACLRLLLPPGLSSGKPLCIFRSIDGSVVPVARTEQVGSVQRFLFAAGTWPFAQTYVTSLVGDPRSLSGVEQAGQLVFRVEPLPRGVHLLIGCDDQMCVIGAVTKN